MPPRRSLIVLSAAIAIAYALWILRSGIQQAVDTPTYSRWADQLIASGFNVAAYLREQNFVAPPLTYLLWITVVAALKTALGASWMAGVVALNWIALSCGAYATIATVRRLTLSSAAMLLSAALFLVAAELLIFVPFVLSDLVFWGLSTGVLVCGLAVAVQLHEGVGMARTIVAGSVMVVMALLFRPVAIPLLLFWIMALAFGMAPAALDRFAARLPAAIVIAAAVAIVIEAYVLAQASSITPGSLPQILVMVGEEARRGMFVHNASPPMLVTPAADLPGFVRITLDKLLFFVTPWLPHYSASHTLMNLLFFVPGYGLSIAAVTNLRRLTVLQRRAASLLAAFIVMVSTFHAMLLVDSDHRYRLPMLPAIVMLASLGLESARRPQTLASTARAR